MSDPKVYWLIVTNIVLGVVVCMLFCTVAGIFVWELLRRVHHRRTIIRELDHELRRYFGPR